MNMPIPAWVNGRLQPVDKMEVHRRGLCHPAVSVFVLNADRVLIQRRALEKYHTPGLWANTCCTHPDWDEPSLDCAVRRLDQELGITGLVPELRDRVEYRADVGGGLLEHERVDIFTAQARADLPITLNPKEVAEVRWIGFQTLLQEVAETPDCFTPWLRIYLDQYCETIFGSFASA